VTPLDFSTLAVGTRRHTKRQWTETRQCASHDLRACRGESGFRARNEEFNPPLRVRERLVGDYLQSQCFRIELQRNVLIVNRMPTTLFPEPLVRLLKVSGE